MAEINISIDVGTAYGLILQLVLDRRARELFDQLSGTISRQIYQGYCNDVATRMVRVGIAETARLVTGTVTVQLYKGMISYVSSSDVPHSLYTNDGSMQLEGSFDHSDSEGFLRVLAVHARALARAGQIK